MISGGSAPLLCISSGLRISRNFSRNLLFRLPQRFIKPSTFYTKSGTLPKKRTEKGSFCKVRLVQGKKVKTEVRNMRKLSLRIDNSCLVWNFLSDHGNRSLTLTNGDWFPQLWFVTSEFSDERSDCRWKDEESRKEGNPVQNDFLLV